MALVDDTLTASIVELFRKSAYPFGVAAPGLPMKPSQLLPGSVTVSHEPTARSFMGVMLDGKPAFVRVVDLGDSMPLYDSEENCYEGYTTLFRVNDGPWFSSEVARSACELNGPRFRGSEDRSVLAHSGVDPASLRDRHGNPL